VQAKRGRSFREFAVICDGKSTIWSSASTQPVLHGTVWILDYYHASENLEKAAIATTGCSTSMASRTPSARCDGTETK
jgi:hypothetical protein